MLAVLTVPAGAYASRASAALLPAQLVPPPPFPLVLAQSFESEFVAPGIERAAYHLQTSAGPLVVSLVTFDPREPTLRIGTVLARDRIVSAGETVSSMAARTGAVAGINADYFDIGNTNSPLGVLAQNGTLLRTPSSRAALTIDRAKGVHVVTLHFTGSALVNGTTPIAVSTVNEYPPHDGASLLTPAYGVPPANADCVIAELTPIPSPSAVSRGSTMPSASAYPDASPREIASPNEIASPGAPAAPPSGRYRITNIDLGTAPQAPGFALALGPAARRGLAALPNVGDLVDVDVETDPPLAELLAAAGGGPALLANGVPVDDPASPGYAERARRIPVAAAALLRDGDVVLLVVDGRRPALSIGLARAELIALLTSLGAVDALQFDSGGSATLVARVLGDNRATVQNDPSDGIERPVADGVFLYSDAPIGPPARLVVRPSRIEALADTAVALRTALVDAAGNPLGAAHGPWQVVGSGATIGTDDVLHTAAVPLSTTLDVSRDGVHAAVPLEIVPAVARITISPERPDLDPAASVTLRAQAFDAQGRPIETGDHVRWSALRGTVSATGSYTAGVSDGFVTATIGDVKASEIVHVGRHVVALPGFDSVEQPRWHLRTVPAGGPGSLAFTPQATLEISYDFRDTERAAYADAGIELGEPLALSCAIEGDAGGAGVRAALVDRYGERDALTLAKTVDWTGPQRHEIRVPAALAPPIVLQSIYVVGSLGTAPVKSAGTIGIHDCSVTLPGTAAELK
jgi:exopolysaccharide biosynthesis protein